ncbi:uncharacterized protein V6R79_004376 [Siganus canaliculatus]
MVQTGTQQDSVLNLGKCWGKNENVKACIKIHAFLSTGTVITSCASCHGDAVCLESGEKGDAFTKPEPYCVCNEGFVGDGVTCYNTKLCSDSSCCGKGYHWSPERGCVDTDECSLPESPCAPHQICHNTQGSFKCLQMHFSHRSSSASLVSVQFSCGSTVCPSGMDCLDDAESRLCVDPCQHYTVLDDVWRLTNNTSFSFIHCDRFNIGQGWYRLYLANTNAHIPEYCVADNRCGTDAPMWLMGTHPTLPGEIVERTVCNSWSGDCCFFPPHTIHIKLCYGNFYVYKLVKPEVCSLAYCAAQPTVSTTPSPTTTTITTPIPETGEEGEIRLLNGNNSCSGRVEIFHQGQWGTVCDDGWSLVDAQVVCRQLGCGRVQSAPTLARYGQGTGPIWLDDVACTGDELKLSECSHRGFGNHNCAHSEDAGIICEADSPVRLVNGVHRCTGRLEIYHDRQWGTVCDDLWDMRDAEVVCRQLDCGSALSAPTDSSFGIGSGPIWMNNVHCNGDEPSITDCSYLGFGINNCNHYEDASVICDVRRPSLQTSTLMCGRDKILIGMDVTQLISSGRDPFTGNLAVHNCSQFIEADGKVWYEVETSEGACGNILRTNMTHAIFYNTLFIYLYNSVTFSVPERLPFSCAYPLETDTSLDVVFEPYLERDIAFSGSGPSARAVMSLFQDPSYNESYPPGQVTLTVGSPLYVGVTVEEKNPRFVAVLEDCYVTYTSNPDDPEKHFLIQNQCTTDRLQVAVTQSGTSLQARFTALFFLFDNEYRDVYLHCRVGLCDLRSFFCEPKCMIRNKRDISTLEHLRPITTGPITCVEISCGEAVCPPDMECLEETGGGGLFCADPCQRYTVLDDDWRSTDNTAQSPLYCDISFTWQGWYRLLLNNTNARIPEYCVPENRTNAFHNNNHHHHNANQSNHHLNNNRSNHHLNNNWSNHHHTTRHHHNNNRSNHHHNNNWSNHHHTTRHHHNNN